MTEQDYSDIAEEAIQKAEKDSGDDSIESFYRGLLTMRQTLETRINVASEDGVDLEALT